MLFDRLVIKAGLDQEERLKRSRYTLEFKQKALRLIKAGQSQASVSVVLGIANQTLSNWLRAEQRGRLTEANTQLVNAEQMELPRLRAEVARLKMERVSSLMIHRVLSEPYGWNLMQADDFRTLSPLIYANINPYGRFDLDMTKRLPIDDGLALAA